MKPSEKYRFTVRLVGGGVETVDRTAYSGNPLNVVDEFRRVGIVMEYSRGSGLAVFPGAIVSVSWIPLP